MVSISAVRLFCPLSLLLFLWVNTGVSAWITSSWRMERRPTSQHQQIRLQMGFLDGLSNFLNKREGDFVKLDQEDEQIYGPGPLLILYHVPGGIENDEIQDMIEDGAPQAFSKRVKLARITTNDDDAPILDVSLKDALQSLVKKPAPETSDELEVVMRDDNKTPVLFFSGFRNQEMMNVYNILGAEIYQESGLTAACAKAVPKAMQKPLRQVLDEICGDHQDAMQMTQPDE